MPSDRSYGNILRSERERSGYDLTSMSRRLHIRPDILQAIENSDFDRMPARGYSKNMVRAYARALKLDEQAITDMFLDEMHMHEVGTPRRASGSRGSYGAGQSSGRRQSARSYDQGRSSREGQRAQASRQRSGGRAGRDLVDPTPAGRPRTSRYDRDAGAPATGGRTRSSRGARQDAGLGERMALGIGSAIGSLTQGRGRQETKVPRSFNTIGSTPPYARSSAGGANSGIAAMNLPMILAIVAAVVVLLIVVVVISNGSKQASEDVPDIPISGLTDTSSPEDNPTGTQVDTAPEFAEFKFTVADGEESWIEVYEDGSSTPSLAEVVKGPAEESFEVRDKLMIKTAIPSVVKLELDGEEVEFEKASGSSVYTYTVDFQQILDQWNVDHGRASSSKSRSSDSSSSASSSSKSSSSKSSSGSSSGSSSSSSSSSRGSQSR